MLLVFDQGPNPAYTRYILDILDHRCAKGGLLLRGERSPGEPRLRPRRSAQRPYDRRGTLVDDTQSCFPVQRWRASGDREGLCGGGQGVGRRGRPLLQRSQGKPFRRRPSITLRSAVSACGLWTSCLATWSRGLRHPSSRTARWSALPKQEKGIIEFHDNRKVTVDALDSILVNLKANGFKLVQILPAENFAPKEEYLANPAKTPTAVAASPSSGAFIEEAKRRVQMAEARQAAEQRRIAEERQEAAGRRARVEAAERRTRQGAAERRERQEAAERRERQEAAERRAAQARYTERGTTTRGSSELTSARTPGSGRRPCSAVSLQSAGRPGKERRTDGTAHSAVASGGCFAPGASGSCGAARTGEERRPHGKAPYRPAAGLSGRAALAERRSFAAPRGAGSGGLRAAWCKCVSPVHGHSSVDLFRKRALMGPRSS